MVLLPSAKIKFNNVRATGISPTRVLVFGWDGVSKKKIIKQLDSLPAIQEIINTGSMVDIHITEDTSTKAGWAQILTGYSADITGVYTNFVFKEIPDGYSIFGRLHKQFGLDAPIENDNIYNLMVTGKGANVGTGTNKLGKHPFFIEKKYLDYQITNQERPNSEVFDLATQGLQDYATNHKNENLFAFIHFHSPDFEGHMYGQDSSEYHSSIESDDYYTSKILEKIKELEIYEDTLIYITSDHGYDDTDEPYRYDWDLFNQIGHHAQAPYVFLASNDKSVKRAGNRYDIASTILSRFNVNLEDSGFPPLSGTSLRGIEKNKPLGDSKPKDSLESDNIKNTFLISWSGTNRSRIKELLNNGELPNLRSLYQEGRLVDIDITTNNISTYDDEFVDGQVSKGPDSVASACVLLTGYGPGVTNCYAPSVYAPEASLLPQGYTIFEHIKDKWPNKSTAFLMGEDSENCIHPMDIDELLVNNKYAVDVYKTHLVSDDEVLGESFNIIDNIGDDGLFAFIHLAKTDVAGHSYGEGSAEYKNAIKESDIQLGKIIEKLRQVDEYEKTLIYVTATSGFDNQDALYPHPAGSQGHTHRMGSYIFLATNDSAITDHGLQIDIASFIAKRFGPDDVLYGDFNGDNIEDMAYAYHKPILSWDVKLGGTNTFKTWASGFGSANKANGKNVTGDFDGDNQDDVLLIFKNPIRGWRGHMLTPNSSGSRFDEVLNVLTGMEAGDIGVYDINNDGKEEVINTVNGIKYCLSLNSSDNKFYHTNCPISDY